MKLHNEIDLKSSKYLGRSILGIKAIRVELKTVRKQDHRAIIDIQSNY